MVSAEATIASVSAHMRSKAWPRMRSAFSTSPATRAIHVDGVYSSDPKRDEGAVVLAGVTWDDVRRLGGGVVQEKAISFAEERGRGFRVSSLGGRGTWVGPPPLRAGLP